MRAHAENALAVAKYLEGSPLVENAIYPGKRRRRKRRRRRGRRKRRRRRRGRKGREEEEVEEKRKGEERGDGKERSIKIFLFQSSVIVFKVGDF